MLTCSLDGDNWLVSRAGRLGPEGTASSRRTHRVSKLTSRSAAVQAAKKRIIYVRASKRNAIAGRPTRCLDTGLTELSPPSLYEESTRLKITNKLTYYVTEQIKKKSSSGTQAQSRVTL